MVETNTFLWAILRSRKQDENDTGYAVCKKRDQLHADHYLLKDVSAVPSFNTESDHIAYCGRENVQFILLRKQY